MPEIPYCGTPPVPGGVAWNPDPVLIATLLVMGGLAMPRLRDAGARRQAASALGWAVLVLALVSPLCNLSVALFSARVAQHLLLILVAAPLIAFGMIGPDRQRAPNLAAPAALFALALWAWHLPGPYAASFARDSIYWAMHASLFGTALWLWAALGFRASVRPDAAALAALATAVQMGLLGALLTLAPRPLFLAVHAPGVTAPWGLSPLEDQQLGGLLMWVPGGLVFAALCVAGLGIALRRARA
ncbi:cytochrome c oxidase assembly protein [Roseomonas hellenica]|uniref:Cytochrome c oxidase assembly protein n=1 Tax=Plastoroseomonas hellenica TaxID=2687306 RepID=A0ABS5EYY2_9PROT|nr:cytochrome c oxidase assembly protein [Plastoroseomonas hellenica]MBR0665511.1 cytochrome c oxidase assembly protein [Plastoroseomonas hellenica]